MNPEERARLAARYAEGPGVLEAALAGIGAEELDFRAGPEEWSPRQIVHHTADSELTSAIRFRKLIAEDGARIQGYDQAEFARRLFYEERPIAPSLAAIRAARESTSSILGLLGDEAFARTGTHSDSGTYSVERWLEIYAAHCHDHADQVLRARAAFKQR